MRKIFKLLSIVVPMVAAMTLASQDRFRLADPQALSGMGNGWSVDAATGELNFVVPVAIVPGEIPIPALFRVAASTSAQRQNQWSSEVVYSRVIWTLDAIENYHQPMLGSLHFGYIDSSSTVSGTTVLEDGIQFKPQDWVAFTSYGSSFTLPQDFGLAPVSIGSVKVTTSGAYAQYTTNLAGLGSTVSGLLAGVSPVGHTAPTQYCVVMDKDRARVMAFLSGLNAWAPLLWLDRFGHHVGFQWSMQTTGLPTGATALHGLVISNARTTARGLQIQWATWASSDMVQDLMRADFIGVDAPSILVRGYPGTASLPPIGFTPDAAADGDVFAISHVAGMIGRPTRIQVGHSNQVPEPIWVGSGSALPMAQPMIVQPPSSLPLREWNLTYDANKAAITDLIDAMGVSTHFDYGTGIFPYPYPQGAHASYGLLWKFGVIGATSTDSVVDPASQTVPQFKRTWGRSAVSGNSWTTTYQEWWPSAGAPERKVELGFGSATQPQQYANKQLALQRILSSDGATEYSKTILSLGVTGLTSADSLTTGIAVTTKDAATYREGYGYSNGMLAVKNRFAGPLTSGETPLEQTNITYDVKKDKLDTGRPLTMTITRTNGVGTTLLPIRTTKFEYDAATRLPIKTYLDGGSDGQMGTTSTFDTEGRLATQANFSSFSTDAVATTTMTYGGDGYPSGRTTVYTRPSNQIGAASVSQAATYDSAGRPVTHTERTGVQGTYGYDTLNRLSSISRQGEEATTASYPDERTRTVTQNGLSVTELSDGFGRLVRRSFPDGRRIDFIYDAHGRRVAQKEFDTTGVGSRTTTSSYDSLDRPTGSTSAGGSSQSMSYAASADYKQSIASTGIAGISGSQKETRDVLSQIVKLEEPTGSVSDYVYDGLGSLKTVTITTTKAVVMVDPDGYPYTDWVPVSQVRSFTANALGLLTSKVEPETGTQTFSGFNALGKPSTMVEASGTADIRNRAILYDGLGRVCKVSSNTGPETIENFFDGAFLTKSTANGPTPVSIDFGYKPAAEGSRLGTETMTLDGLSYGLIYNYLPSGRLDTIHYPAGRIVGYGYDTLGRVNAIQDRTGGGSISLVSNITFDEWGNRRRLTFGSGAYSDWSSQDAGTHLKDWTIGYTTGGLGDPANPRTHTYDLAERLTKAGEWQNLLHDGAHRLAHAEAPALGVSSVDLNHDGFGNNTSQQMTGTSASSFNNFSFDPLIDNQIPSTTITGGITDWEINGRGEAKKFGAGTSSWPTTGLTWDALGRVKTLLSAGLNQTYLYAPSNLRVRIQDAATPTNNRHYAYTSGGLLMSEYTDSGWKRDVVYLGSEAVAEIDAAGAHELHRDHLGTPRIVTSGTTAQIEGKQSYGPYGEYLTAQAAGYTPLTGYTGHLQNEPSGLIYMRGRFYSPAWHRFMNSDQGVDPNSWNQMAYVGGSPFMGIDPSGMKIIQIGWYCVTTTKSYSWHDTGQIFAQTSSTECSAIYASVSGASDGGAAPSGDSKPQTPKDKKDCADKAYANLVAAVGAAPSIEPALKQAGTLKKFTKDFFAGFSNTNAAGMGFSLWFGRLLLIGAEIPGAQLMTSPALVGNAIAGFGNILINPSDPVGDAMQTHNAVVDKAISDYKAAIKNCN